MSAEIYHADDADGDTMLMTVESTREQLEAVDSPRAVDEVLGGMQTQTGCSRSTPAPTESLATSTAA